MLTVKKASYHDIPEFFQDEAPDNGVGAEDANYLMVMEGDEVLQVYSDAMEPEDATFNRDLRWVSDAIQAAYEHGLKSK